MDTQNTKDMTSKTLHLIVGGDSIARGIDEMALGRHPMLPYIVWLTRVFEVSGS
jgi:hypothetical protein